MTKTGLISLAVALALIALALAAGGQFDGP